jgi:hypothetical protein
LSIEVKLTIEEWERVPSPSRGVILAKDVFFIKVQEYVCLHLNDGAIGDE